MALLVAFHTKAEEIAIDSIASNSIAYHTESMVAFRMDFETVDDVDGVNDGVLHMDAVAFHTVSVRIASLVAANYTVVALLNLAFVVVVALVH